MLVRLVLNTITSASRLAAITMMVMNLVSESRDSSGERSSRRPRTLFDDELGKAVPTCLETALKSHETAAGGAGQGGNGHDAGRFRTAGRARPGVSRGG